MHTTECPRCKTKCNVSKEAINLGNLINCSSCGCRFESLATNPVFPQFRLGVRDKPVTSHEPAPTAPKEATKPPPPRRKPSLIWQFFLILIVIWSALSFFFGLSAITFLLPISLILLGFFGINRSEYKRSHSKTFVYFVFDKATELFACLSIVVAFYLVAAWMFDGSSDESTLAYLWQLEDRFESFKQFLSSYVIFKPWVSAILIALLIGIDLLYSYSVGFDPARRTPNAGGDGKPKSLVSRYLAFQRLSKRAYIVLAFLCAFTFFGNAVAGEKIARVQVRIEKIRTGYEEACEETEGILTTAVQQDLLEQIDNYIAVGSRASTFVFKYHHNIVYSSNSRVESLRQTYSKANSTPKIVIERGIEARVKKTTSKPPPAYNGPRSVSYSDNPAVDTAVKTERYPPKSRPAALSDLTLGKIEEVKNSFKRAPDLPRSISAIKLADGTEVLVQLPKSFTNVVKGAALNDLVVRFPFLEPMFNALVSAFDKTMEEKIKSKVGPHLNRMLDRWFPGKTLTPADFEYEANEIVNSSKITLTNEVIKNTKAATGEFAQVISESDTLIKKLKGQIEIATAATRPRVEVNTLPVDTLPGDTLPEATCAKTAKENYETRLSHAKTMQDRINAGAKYLADLRRLEWSDTLGFPGRDTLGFPGRETFGFPRRETFGFPRRETFGLPRLKPG